MKYFPLVLCSLVSLNPSVVFPQYIFFSIRKARAVNLGVAVGPCEAGGPKRPENNYWASTLGAVFDSHFLICSSLSLGSPWGYCRTSDDLRPSLITQLLPQHSPHSLIWA